MSHHLLFMLIAQEERESVELTGLGLMEKRAELSATTAGLLVVLKSHAGN
jgi:hypothetical protein